jgi:two-component system chemotaxis response regulator CheB
LENQRVFLLPGEVVIARKPTVIATLLGSCVAVCLYNTKEKFGGMNHFLLPSGSDESIENKYGDVSTNNLIDHMVRFDADVKRLVAKVYGGGSVVGHLSLAGFDIGARNIEMAIAVLAQRGVRIVERDTGGTHGRKIYFDNATGEVDMRLIQKSELSAKLEEKKRDMANRRARALVVDDSSTVRDILVSALSADPGIHVVGQAKDAFEARNMILELDPDVITLDVIMPRMDGLAFLKKLMVYYPKPIIIVSSVAQRGSVLRQRAADIGAVDVIDKEDLKLYEGMDAIMRLLNPKVKLAAERVVKKRLAGDVKDI